MFKFIVKDDDKIIISIESKDFKIAIDMICLELSIYEQWKKNK